MSDTATSKKPPPTVAENHPETLNGRFQSEPVVDGHTQVKLAIKAIIFGFIMKFLGIFQGLAEASLRQYFAWLLRIIGFVVMFIVNQTIEAAGIREFSSDIMEMKLFRLPFLTFLGGFKETRQLDLANVVAVILLLFTYIAVEAVVHGILCPSEQTRNDRYILIVPAFLLLIADAVVFGAGIYVKGSLRFLIAAIALAVLYDCVLVLFARFIVNIERKKS